MVPDAGFHHDLPPFAGRRTLSRERELERTLGARGARSKNKTRSAQRLLSGMNRKT